ncbi:MULTISPECIES: phosphopantetheine-binding protein [Streptomycetaceae]|uniref:phosphopantetheine-binding protein n=1 Tax=Streptomycetaceae TaxID=2062 RepID=UPI000CDC2910|nr:MULTISPECIES: phosphopantetheine-binding protein [Streptomycetaceae]AUY50397.1 phosphopantetheine-binding protein [Streptomyces sp. CB01881]MBP0451906.1 acyl carrier protein [Kitasatospora sp. RG8]TYC73785.1 acyl carrier protein [Streptomyces sp. CB01881]
MWDETFEEILLTYLPFLDEDEKLEADTPLRDLGLDSLGTVELLASLENAYDVRFQDDALSLETFRSPGVLWAALSSLLQPAA